MLGVQLTQIKIQRPKCTLDQTLEGKVIFNSFKTNEKLWAIYTTSEKWSRKPFNLSGLIAQRM